MNAYRLQIILKGSDPIIKRMVSVPAYATFEQLHQVIQSVFGWRECHLYQFNLPEAGVNIQGSMDEDDFSDTKKLLAEDVSLSDYFKKGESLTYIYDFGDWWEHQIVVEDEVEQEESYALLLSWEQGNACEDAGGMDGYYEKCKILKDPSHPEYEDIKEWMEEQMIPMDEEEVERELQDIFIESLPPGTVFEDICDELMELVVDEALIKISENGQDTYVLLRDCEDGPQSVRIYENETDFLNGYLNLDDHNVVHPLYQNGYLMEYPDYRGYEENEELDDILEFRYSRYRYGVGAEIMDEEETEKVFYILRSLLIMSEHIAEDIDFYPMLGEHEMLHIIKGEDRFKVGILTYEPELKKSRLKIAKKDEEALSHAKPSTERLSMSIVSIPNLLQGKDAFHYYIIASGKKNGFTHQLNSYDLPDIMKQIRNHLVTYMIQYGIPREIRTDDTQIMNLLETLLEQYKVKLKHARITIGEMSDAYEAAFLQSNPITSVDEALFEKLSNMDEEETLLYLESLNEDELEMVMKQLYFMSFFEHE